MPGRDKINGYLDRAVASISHLFYRGKIKRASLILVAPPEKPDISFTPDMGRVGYSIRTNVHRVEACVSDVPVIIMPRLQSRLREQVVGFDVKSSGWREFRCFTIRDRKIGFKNFKPVVRMVDAGNFRVIHHKTDDFEFGKSVTGRMEPIDRRSFRSRGLEIKTRGRTINGTAKLCKLPIIRRPIPWSNLDRHMILACWEFLRGEAVEQTGKAPGRSLEMLGIFLNVDLEGIHHTAFDPNRRELRLYPYWAYRRGKSGRKSDNPYVIIGGTVKDSNTVLQVIINPESCGWRPH